MRRIKLFAAAEGLLFGMSMFFFTLDYNGGPEGLSSRIIYSKEAKLIREIIDREGEHESELPEDCIGFLSVDGTSIEYPVMRDRTDSEGNYYYLTHNYLGNEDSSGCPFIRRSQTLEDDLITIFAHNNRNGTMFADLRLFEDEAFFDRYREITLDTETEIRSYEVVSVMDVSVFDDAFSFWGWNNLPDEDTEEEFLDQIINSSVIHTDEELSPGNQYLMLVTCEYSHDNGRRIVVAVRRR
ncbi:MAG: class B sortase [Clostridiales bacterium]|nr:class B sortase [Clostridiales bacterium]